MENNNNDLMRKYELVVIVDAKLSNEEKEDVRREATEIVNKGGGKVTNSQVWLDKHKFTFRIKKRNEGSYYLIKFESKGSTLDPIRSALKLNERVLRFVTTRIE